MSPDFSPSVLLTLLVASVISADALLAILVDRLGARALSSGSLGFGAALIYFAAPATVPLSGVVYLDAAAAATASIAFTLFGSLNFWVLRHIIPARFADGGKRIFSPQSWSGNRRLAPLTINDWARRWFVTIAAATGGVVGAISADQHFGAALAKALSASHLIFAIALTVVSFFLVGPIEEFIFHRDTGTSQPDRDMSDLIARLLEHRSWHAAGRLVLVGLAAFALTIVHGCFGEAATQGVRMLVIMVVASIIPGIVTYYWAAALQVDADKIWLRAGYASFAMGWYLSLFLFVPLLADTVDERPGQYYWRLFISNMASMAIVLAIGFFCYGAFAVAGGVVLDWTRRRPSLGGWPAIGVLGAALATTVVANTILVGTAIHLAAPDITRYLPPAVLPIFLVAGWILALGVSDFPRIVTDAKRRVL